MDQRSYMEWRGVNYLSLFECHDPQAASSIGKCYVLFYVVAIGQGKYSALPRRLECVLLAEM